MKVLGGGALCPAAVGRYFTFNRNVSATPLDITPDFCDESGISVCVFFFVFFSQDVGLTLTIPVISAGSFGLSCDFKEKLTRLLPPARKVSSFFVYFWNVTVSRLKPKRWKTAYIYKQQTISEECFWYALFVSFPSSCPTCISSFINMSGSVCGRYINALEASTAEFSTLINRKVLRSKDDVSSALALTDAERHSNSELPPICYYNTRNKTKE